MGGLTETLTETETEKYKKLKLKRKNLQKLKRNWNGKKQWKTKLKLIKNFTTEITLVNTCYNTAQDREHYTHYKVGSW